MCSLKCFAGREVEERGYGGGVRVRSGGRPPTEDRQLQDRAARSLPRQRQPPQDGQGQETRRSRRRHHQLLQVSSVHASRDLPNPSAEYLETLRNLRS